MAITHSEFDHFVEFAVGRLDRTSAKSISELAAEWESKREYEETVAEIRESVIEMEAGGGRPLREVDAELRAKHGFAPRRDT